jgi:predicted transcriptional regulator
MQNRLISVVDIIYILSMRTLIDMEDQQVRELDDVARRLKLSRAAIVRRAVAEFLDRNAIAELDDAFGLWGDRKEDGVEYQDKLRSEW